MGRVKMRQMRAMYVMSVIAVLLWDGEDDEWRSFIDFDRALPMLHPRPVRQHGAYGGGGCEAAGGRDSPTQSAAAAAGDDRPVRRVACAAGGCGGRVPAFAAPVESASGRGGLAARRN